MTKSRNESERGKIVDTRIRQFLNKSNSDDHLNAINLNKYNYVRYNAYGQNK